MRKTFAIAALIVLATILGATVFREPVAWAAQAVDSHITNLDANGNIKVHEQGTASVNVTNAAVPVEGTVGATQSGTWTVGVAGTPAVTSADETKLIGSYAQSTDPGFTSVIDADIRWARSIRVMSNCFDPNCSNILVRVYTAVGSRSYLIDQFPMDNTLQAQTHVYQVVGESLSVQLVSSNTGPTSNVGVAAFGRAN